MPAGERRTDGCGAKMQSRGTFETSRMERFFWFLVKSVYRVVTDCRDYRGNRILEPGPWFSSQQVADHWAEVLRSVGYRVIVEKLEGTLHAQASLH